MPYASQPRRKLLTKTFVFYLGLAAALIALALIPLEMGISAVSRLVYGQRSTLILISGIVIISFGVFQLLGGDFEIGGPLSPAYGREPGEHLRVQHLL